MVGVWYRRKLRGTREASNGGRVRVRIIHGLDVSHKELTYLLRKIYQPSKQNTMTHAPRGRLVGINHRAPDLHAKINNQNTMRANLVTQLGDHTCMLRESQTLTPIFLLNHNHSLVPPTYQHLYIAKLLQGIKHIIFSDLQVYVGFYD